MWAAASARKSSSIPRKWWRRGPPHGSTGRPEATFVVERLVEVAARELAVEPAELRRKNFIRNFPYQTPVIMSYDTGDYHGSLRKALELADIKSLSKRKRESARNGKLRG